MKDVKIDDSELEQMRTIAKDIQKCLGDTHKQCQTLQSSVNAGLWSGDARDAFATYLEILEKYHKQLHDISKKQVKALNNLVGYFEDFHNDSEVQKVKSL